MTFVEVIYTDEFGGWYDSLTEAEQDDVATVVKMLELAGVALGYPAASALKGGKYALRELRPNRGRSPLRVVYAFDPSRDAVLIIGGDKSSDAKFYERVIRRGERIWKEYLAELTAAAKKTSEEKKP